MHFLLEKIYLCGITPQPPHKEIIRTAIGANRSVEWEYRESVLDTIKEQKAQGKTIILIEQTDISVPLSNFKVDKNLEYVIVMGNEVNGVNANLLPLADHCIEITQHGTKHSLNVSVCAGIVFWHFGKVMI